MNNSKKSARKVDSGKQVEIWTLLSIVWRRWGIISLLLGIILSSVTAAVVVKQFQRSYKAKLYFRIIHNMEWVSLARGVTGKQDPSSVLSMIKSDILSNRLTSNPEVAALDSMKKTENIGRAIKESIEIKREGGELYSLIVKSTFPEDSAFIAEQIWKEFSAEQSNFKERQSNILLEALTGEISQVTGRFKLLESELQRTHDLMSHKESTIQQDDAGRVWSTQLGRLEKAKFDTIAQVKLKEQQIQRNKNTKWLNDLLESEIDTQIESLASVARARQKLAELTARSDEYSRSLGSSHPQRVATDRLIQRAKRELDEERKLSRSVVVVGEKRAFDRRMTAEKERYEREVEELKFGLTELDKQIVEEGEKVQAYRQLKFDYERKQEERNEIHSTLLALKQKSREVKLRQVAPFNVSRVYSGDKAEQVAVPKSPVELYPTKQLGLAGLLGLLPLVLSFLWEYRVSRISHPDQIQSMAGLIGEIAHLPTRINSRSRQKVEMFRESIASVCTYLKTYREENDIRSVAITSAVSNEGKTTVSAHIALNFARMSGKTVLLIDGDMRSPSIENIYGLELEPGLADVLSGNLDLSQAVEKSKIEKLHVLTAGVLRTNPHRLIGAGKFAQLLRQAEQEYDFIVIDTPPVLAASEAIVAAKEADTSIICVMRDVSRIEVVQRAYRKLMASRVDVAGYVFNGVPQAQYAYRYGGYEYAKVAHQSEHAEDELQSRQNLRRRK